MTDFWMNRPDTSPIVTYTISIARNGDITNDVQHYGNSFADVYRAFHAIKAEVDRQIAERRQCPYNPRTIKQERTSTILLKRDD